MRIQAKAPVLTHRDFLFGLIVVAEKSVVKPFANVIGNYNCNDSLQNRIIYGASLLSAAELPEWSGDNSPMKSFKKSSPRGQV
jgi:hypothetical protein